MLGPRPSSLSEGEGEGCREWDFEGNSCSFGLSLHITPSFVSLESCSKLQEIQDIHPELPKSFTFSLHKDQSAIPPNLGELGNVYRSVLEYPSCSRSRLREASVPWTPWSPHFRQGSIGQSRRHLRLNTPLLVTLNRSEGGKGCVLRTATNLNFPFLFSFCGFCLFLFPDVFDLRANTIMALSLCWMS